MEDMEDMVSTVAMEDREAGDYFINAYCHTKVYNLIFS